MGCDSTSQFHDYAFVWKKDSVRWFVDGRQVHEVREDLPTAPGKIYLNVWIGGTFLHRWAGPFQYPGSPIVADIERVAFTAEGNPYQFAGSLACQTSNSGVSTSPVPNLGSGFEGANRPGPRYQSAP